MSRMNGQRRAGEDLRCPHCGKDSFLVKKNIMDGWKVAGAGLFCSSCSAKISDLNTDSGTEQDSKKVSSKSKLAALLGEDGDAPAPKLEVADGEKSFCRDCAHFISHPFLSRCTIHSKNVEPMDDCSSFSDK